MLACGGPNRRQGGVKIPENRRSSRRRGNQLYEYEGPRPEAEMQRKRAEVLLQEGQGTFASMLGGAAGGTSQAAAGAGAGPPRR